MPTPPAKTLVYKTRTRQELAEILGISYHTLRRRMLQMDPPVKARNLLSIQDQIRILEFLGYAHLWEEEEPVPDDDLVPLG
ncbi:MAG: hypothetical protein WBA17_02040 [Saprospiraceae bacterium]